MFSGQRFVRHLSRRRRRHCHHHDVVVDVCNNSRCITTFVASVTSVGSKSLQPATSTEVIIPIPKPSSSCLHSRAFSSSSSSSSFSETPPLPITSFTEDELMTQEAVRSWSKEVLNPLKVRKMDDESKMCPKIIEDLFTQGFMGIEIPEEYDGGSGLSFTASCITIEELARVDPSVAIMVDIHNTCIINSIRFWGSTQLQNQFLSKLASTSVSSFCLSESESGSDAFSLKTTATKSNDESYYTINGNKMWISNAKEANTLLVFANVDPSLKYKGITAFVLDVNDYEHIILDSDNTTESAGGSSNANANANTNAHNNGTITIGLPEKKLGLKASSTCPIHFDNVKVPASQILGEVGLGYKYCIEILNEGRIGIAAQQLGIAKGCLYDIALPYMLERKQFNKPIGEFQGMEHQYAQIATEIHAVELMTYNACRRKELGLSFIKEASMVKLYSAQVAEKTASKTIEWLGGIGFTQDLLAEKFYRDCKVGSIYEGTTNMQLQTIAKLLRSEYS